MTAPTAPLESQLLSQCSHSCSSTLVEGHRAVAVEDLVLVVQRLEDRLQIVELVLVYAHVEGRPFAKGDRVVQRVKQLLRADLLEVLLASPLHL